MDATVQERSLKLAQNWVDGKVAESTSGKTIDVINPATGEVLTTAPRGGAEDVDHAVAAARRAFENPAWRDMNPSARSKMLWSIGEVIEKNLDELAMLESLNAGKTLKGAKNGDMRPAADIFKYYAGWVRALHSEVIPVDGPFLNYTLREPVGVVGMITAWNYPMLLAAWKVAPALATGCTYHAAACRDLQGGGRAGWRSERGHRLRP